MTRQTDLRLLYHGASSSSGRGVEYPVVLRNTGTGTFWDMDLRASHDGEETDRKTVRRLGPESETDPIFLLIPARLCDEGRPAVGLLPLGHVVFEAVDNGEVVASVELPRATPENQPEFIHRVPRTTQQEAELLRIRPDAWEYLLYASVLRRKMDELEPKYRDHELRFARRTGGRVLEGGEALRYLGDAFGDASANIENVSRVFDPATLERAFGPLGTPGDPILITHLGERVIEIYDGLLDWAATLRGLPVPDEFERVVELSSSFADAPIRQFREFVAEIVDVVDRIPSIVAAASETPKIELSLIVSVDPVTEANLDREFKRLEALFGEDI